MIPQKSLLKKNKKKKNKEEIRFVNFITLFGLLPALLVLHLHAIAITVLLGNARYHRGCNLNCFIQGICVCLACVTYNT